MTTEQLDEARQVQLVELLQRMQMESDKLDEERKIINEDISQSSLGIKCKKINEKSRRIHVAMRSLINGEEEYDPKEYDLETYLKAVENGESISKNKNASNDKRVTVIKEEDMELFDEETDEDDGNDI